MRIKRSLGVGCLVIFVLGTIGNIADHFSGKKKATPKPTAIDAADEPEVVTPEPPKPAPERRIEPAIAKPIDPPRSTPAPSRREVENEIAVSPSSLLSEFLANEVSATETYGGKLVLLTGTVDSVGVDLFGAPYVILETSERFRRVQCLFERGKASATSSLRKGDPVSIRGRCGSMIVNVVVSGCEVAR